MFLCQRAFDFCVVLNVVIDMIELIYLVDLLLCCIVDQEKHAESWFMELGFSSLRALCDHAERISGTAWGGGPELQILAHLLQCLIRIIAWNCMYPVLKMDKRLAFICSLCCCTQAHIMLGQPRPIGPSSTFHTTNAITSSFPSLSVVPGGRLFRCLISNSSWYIDCNFVFMKEFKC